MRLVLQIVGAILISAILVFGGCTLLMYQGAKELEVENRKEALELAKQAQAAAERFTQGLRDVAKFPPRPQVVDVAPLADDQTCVNHIVYFIDRSTAGGSVARLFTENGQQVPCHDRMRQRLQLVAPAGATTQ
jgi:hypothetical protein